MPLMSNPNYVVKGVYDEIFKWMSFVWRATLYAKNKR
jgi:hypothetical protein